MFSKKSIFILILVIIFVAGIGYWQYRVHRTPISTVAVPSITEQIVSGGPQPNAIPAIDGPLFESVAAADQYLDDKGFGIVFEKNGRARFYPYQILVWHEVVNDMFGEQPLLISYSPLVGAGMVFERSIAGSVEQFSVSGSLYNNDHLLEDDSTHSLWSPLLHRAIVGSREGSVLTQLPSQTISWDTFKRNFPTGQVLSRNTGFVRDYTRNPYPLYEESHAVYFPVSHDDARLPSKSIVFGAVTLDGPIAVEEHLVEKKEVLNLEGTIPVLVVWDSTLQTARAYERTSLFSLDETRLIDDETGSVWNTKGEAVSGPQRGKKLEPVLLTRTYWFAWSAMYPQTSIQTNF